MDKNHLHLLLAICLTTIGCKYNKNVKIKESDITTCGINVATIDSMTVALSEMVDGGQIAGVQTAILHNDEIVHFNNYGYSDLSQKTPITDSTLFRMYSMTKPIVSVAILQLYESGQLRLEDDICKFLPTLQPPGIWNDGALQESSTTITVLDLLRHTSGYSYGRSSDAALREYYHQAELNNAINNQDYLQRLSTIPLQFKPGTDWQYGLSTNLCGHIVEAVSGLTLKAYLQEHILYPLGMYDTHFAVPDEKIHRYTVGYGWSNTDGLYVADPLRDGRFSTLPRVYNGGGGLVSTALDYLKFCKMILHRGLYEDAEILQPATVDLMLQDHLKEVWKYQNHLRLPPNEDGFGLGLAIRELDDGSLVHGWGGAAGTYFKIDMDKNLAYIMMIQLSPYRHLGLRESFHHTCQHAVCQSLGKKG